MKHELRPWLRSLILHYRHSGPARFMLKAARFYLSAYHNESNNNWEENGEAALVRTVLGWGPKRPVVFDAGANAGDWTKMVKQFCPDAEIHAFEIVPAVAKKLSAALAQTPGVTINPFGLSRLNSTVPLRYYPSSDTGSSMYDFPWGLEYEEIAGKVVKGGDYLSEHGIDRINLLKLDVEGAEGDVIEGFRSSFEKNNIDVIQFEYTRICIKTKYLLFDFYKFFEEKGYLLGRLYPDGVDIRPYDIWHDENFMHTNFVAVRGNLDPGMIDELKSFPQ